MNIYISPTNQPNTYPVGNTTEQKECAKIAKVVGDTLSNYQVNYKIGDEKQLMWITDKGKLTGGRIKEAIDWGADYYIELHTNAGSSTATGATCFIRFINEMPKLANALIAGLNGICPYKSNRSTSVHEGFSSGWGAVKYPELGGVRGMLLEINFHSNIKVAKWIIENTKSIGEMIGNTLAFELGLKEKENKKEKENENNLPELWRINKGVEIKTKPPLTISKSGIYTITEKRGNWGKLKSGIGWVDLTQAKNIGR